jgi:hypothetical protein
MGYKRTEEEKKQLIKFIISLVSRGCPITGRNGIMANLPPNPANPTSLTDFYNWLRVEPEMRKEYRQAQRIGKTKRMTTEHRISVKDKREYMRKIIEYVGQGYTIRGKQSAIKAAAIDMGLQEIHWQTFWVWLRYQMPEFQDEYREAVELRKARTRARRKLEN